MNYLTFKVLMKQGIYNAIYHGTGGGGGDSNAFLVYKSIKKLEGAGRGGGHVTYK